MFLRLFLELSVIEFGSIDGRYSKDGIKSVKSGLLLFLLDASILCHIPYIHQLTEGVCAFVTLSLLVKVFQYICYNLADALRSHKRGFGVDGLDLLIPYIILFFNRVDEINSERKHIAVIDSIHNSICMKLVSEGLLRGLKIRSFARSSINCKYRRACKSEYVVVLEMLGNLDVHLAELRAMTFIKNQNTVLVIYLVIRIALYEIVEFLNSGNKDFIFLVVSVLILVLKLPLQYGCASAAVGRTLFEAVIFFHCLVVEVFPVYHKEHLVYIRKPRSKLSRLERCQSLAASRGMPNVASGIHSARFLVIGRNLYTIQYALSCHNLVWAHYH